MKSGQASLSGGEVSASIAARIDVAKRGVSLARGRNTLGLPQGGQYNRAGFEFCDALKDHEKRGRLVSFVFAADQAYTIEVTPNLMRFYYQGGLVLQPRLQITGITQSAQAIVTVPAHGYTVGKTVVFSGVEGMTQINGLRARVIEVIDADNFKIDLDTSTFSAFTGDTGGVPGNVDGGSGGHPPPPPEGQDPPPVEVPDNPPPPPTPPRHGHEMEIIETYPDV